MVFNNKICPFCKGKNTKVFFSLNMPLFHSAVTEEELKDSLFYGSHRFEASLCFDCGLGFNSNPISKEITEKLFKNYHYVRPSQGIGNSRYDDFIPLVKKYAKKTDYIFEIGCSDGFLLDKFYDDGYTNIEGIEPSYECELAKHKYLIQNNFFTEKTKLKEKADIIYSTHVLDCTFENFDVFKNIKNNLSENGKIIFEVTKFGGFYLHKLFFFTLPFIIKLAASMNMSILHFEETNAIRVVLGNPKEDNSIASASINELWNEAIQKEKEYRNLISKVEEFISNKELVYWWGTGVSSIVTLSNINPDILKKTKFVFIDSDKARKGLILPIKELIKYRIKNYIGDVENVLGNKDALVIASMYSKEILSILAAHNVFPDNYIVVTL